MNDTSARDSGPATASLPSANLPSASLPSASLASASLASASPVGAMQVAVRRVTADVVHPLRHAVLRTGRPWADVIYSADADPLSAHFAAISMRDHRSVSEDSVSEESLSEDAIVLAVGSVLPEPTEWDDRSSAGAAWRVRGMAVRPDSRGSGLGTQILGCLIAHVSASGGGLVWCTARLAAVSLYERAGLRSRGVPGDIPGIGPHQVMFGMVAASPGPVTGLGAGPDTVRP